jgi:hypothetical protein
VEKASLHARKIVFPQDCGNPISLQQTTDISRRVVAGSGAVKALNE